MVNEGILERPLSSKKKTIFSGSFEESGGAVMDSKEDGIVDEDSLEVP